MKKYRKRIADMVLKNKLSAKGAVLIEGAKWCGKTTTAAQIAGSILYMQDPRTKKQNMMMAELDPSLLLDGETPRLLDEWQIAPQLWDAVRFEVDQRDSFGQFILTGSAVPILDEETTHTGTGRISRMKMRPMSLFESGDSVGTVSLRGLFQSPERIAAKNPLTLKDVAFLICRGGWPKALQDSEKIALQQAFDYYDAVVESDISRVDGISRNPERVKLLMRSYARNIGSQAATSAIKADLSPNETSSLDEDTIYSYMNALRKIFVIEDMPAWNPNLRSKTAIRTHETRYFVDPSIATAALGLGPQDLINDLNTMGFYFENLCIRDLRVFADLLDGEVYHYRDKTELECDAVVHLRNGSYGLIEIKLGGERLIEEGAKTLTALRNRLDTGKMKEPSFMMILTGTDSFAYRREDGIYVVPIGCLKD